MLFACGMGNGLFFYSVFEPIYHYTERNRYSADPTLPDNQLAQTAILIPMFHFGNCYSISSIILLKFNIIKRYLCSKNVFVFYIYRAAWLGNVFVSRFVTKPDVLSRKTTSNNEILFIPTNWRLYIWMDWRGRRCNINHVHIIWGLYQSWYRRTPSQYGTVTH